MTVERIQKDNHHDGLYTEHFAIFIDGSVIITAMFEQVMARDSYKPG